MHCQVKNRAIFLYIKSMAYSSQGNHTRQLDLFNRLADGSTTGNVISTSSVKYIKIGFLNQIRYLSTKYLPNCSPWCRVDSVPDLIHF